jgi:HAE1 family hydrophobic/amphiphilic exporter-1
MYWITKLALKKPWVTYILTAILVGVCLWGTITLKQELFPDIELPMTTVVTVYPQAQPQDVMDKVTIPVESAISSIKGLKHLTSTSSMNTSVVFAEFEYGTKMDRVNAIIAENLVKITLPQEVRNLPNVMPQVKQNPRVIPLNINSLPVVTFSVYGDVPLEQLSNIASDQIVPELKKVAGAFDATVSGGSTDEIIVNPSVEKMEGAGLSESQLAGILVTRKYNSLSDMQNALLSPAGPAMKDVADISIGLEPGATINRTNGKPSVSITVTKTADANTVRTANALTTKAAELQQSLPAGVELVTVSDQSTYVENSISNLTNDALIGGLLAVAVVFVFLMAVRASLVTAMSIPMSVLIGFLIMHFTNITVNILTLSAMTLAIGRVIDDSIVMVEVTYRRMQAGEKFPQATINGAREIVNAITSATITTVVIFVPLALVGGIVGEMFVPFALTITFTMLGSLLTALTIVPSLTKILDTGKRSVRAAGIPWYQKIYTPILKWCLARRGATIGIAVVVFMGSLGLLPVIGTSFMPELNTSVVQVQIEMPEGTSPAAVLKTVEDIEAVLVNNSDVRTYSSTIGSSQGSGMSAAFGGGGGGGASASITVGANPKVRTKDALARLRDEIGGISTPGTVTVDTVTAMSAGSSSIELAVRGNTLEDITSGANDLAVRMGQISGVGERDVVVGKAQSQVIITPDPAKMAAAGLTAQASQLQGEFLLLKSGGTVGSTSVGGTSYGIYIQSVAQQISSPTALNDMRIGAVKPVKLADIATVQVLMLPTELRRTDQKLAASVTATVTTKNVGAVNQAIQQEIKKMTLPPGVEIGSGGVFEDMKDSFSRMYISILVAIALSYIVLVITFRSFLKSLIIMVSLPLASVGALLGLLITGHTLGVIGLMGILMLVGIVLTNAIVLLAYVEQLEKGGLSLADALVKGGETRLRPILMTALVTLFAMLPMALGLGEGVIVAAELAVVVIGGLFSSTMLTLLVVPVIYSLIYGNRQKAVK